MTNSQGGQSNELGQSHEALQDQKIAVGFVGSSRMAELGASLFVKSSTPLLSLGVNSSIAIRVLINSTLLLESGELTDTYPKNYAPNLLSMPIKLPPSLKIRSKCGAWTQ